MLWIQGFHVIFVVCWFAGIFYLPRILVYYAQSPDVETKAVLAVMARKLYRFVTPFMVLAIALGLWRLSFQWVQKTCGFARIWRWSLGQGSGPALASRWTLGCIARTRAHEPFNSQTQSLQQW